MNQLSIGALLACSLVTACAAEHAADAELSTRTQKLSTPRSFAFKDAYNGELLGTCSPLQRQDIAGYEPEEAGAYPVFVYLTGTLMTFNGPDARNLTEDMARRGFVAATVEYTNGLYPPECGLMTTRAKCVFNASSPSSAIARICAHPKAACATKGIVVAGFSQGANMASLARNYDPRARAAFLMGHGANGLGGLPLGTCLFDSSNAFTSSQMRAVNGEYDFFFGNTPHGVRSRLELASGVSCPGAWDCLQADGSGWYMVKGSELGDGHADHCYFYSNANLTCSAFSDFDASWNSGPSVWAKPADLDWLAAKATP
jgi:dienelactone hydrolase